MKNPRFYGKPPFGVAVIHGGPGATGEMAPVARELSSDMGILEPLQTATSLDAQVEELRTILEQKGNLPVTLIGYSWGAWLVYILAARHQAPVRKLVLVGSGPFEMQYVAEIQDTRLSRLSVGERGEIDFLLETIGNPDAEGRDTAFLRFGALFSKSDAYDPIPHDCGEGETECQVDIFQSVWEDAAELRRSGELLDLGKQVECPVVAIHGDYDPHPAEGVRKPLSAVMKNFRFILLEHCGHTPWAERQARDRFYRILKEELLDR